MLTRVLLFCLAFVLEETARACDLCAIYNADSAENGASQGFSFAISEQFVPYGTVQLDGREVPPSILDQAFLDSLITHLVPAWNFSKAFSVSLSVPVINKEFYRFQRTATGILTESGSEKGLGDVSLVGRWRILNVNHENASISLNVLAGVKFPTGDDDRLEDEVELTRELDAIYGQGHQHAVGGIHIKDLTLGSGSFDGVFGVTVNSRWRRLLCNVQFQYYLRTKGDSDYQIGNELMVSVGPGIYLMLRESFTVNVQTLATYENQDSDVVLGRENTNTGMTAFYLGPQLNLTLGERFSANAGVDLPKDVDNRGLQNVPDYRIRAGLSFRF